MPPSKNVLEVKHLAKSYGSYVGVSDIDLTVKRGSLHGFLGPNGAGKTTTLKCVMRLLRRSSGEISLFGKAFDGIDDVELKSRIGYSAELPFWPAYLSGEEVLGTYARMRGLREDDGKDLLQKVGLGEAASKRVSKYSRGMQSRLGVAVALLGSPELLLLDEPIAGMDPVGVMEMRNMLRQLASEGRTVVLSSHQLNEVEQTCSHITVVSKGRTVAEGSLDELTSKAQEGVQFVVEFVSIPETLLQAISRLPGVTDVSRIPDKLNTILVRTGGEIDIREKLARAGADNGSLMLSCERHRMSLEALFFSRVNQTRP